jgi:hypothetical protein
MVVLSHLATDCSLLPATFQDLRFGIKFIFSSKIEIIDACKGVKFKPWFFYPQKFPSPPLPQLTVMNEDILGVMFRWKTLLFAK